MDGGVHFEEDWVPQQHILKLYLRMLMVNSKMINN